jgi:pimeloyl-ACP methyl ester carboxylesterase
MSYLSVNDINLYYEEHGSGSPLILIAGLASDSQSWLPVVESLSRQYRVIIFDNRGSGRTIPQDAKTSIQMMADDCIALVRHLKLPHVHLLGHSMGGFVALDCAIRYPHSISKLILVGTSAFDSDRNNALFSDWASCLETEMDTKLWFRNIFYWIFSRRFFEDAKSVETAVGLAAKNPYPQSKTAFRNQVEAIKTFNCLKELSNIRSETLMIFGKEDLLFPPKKNSKILRTIPMTETALIAHAAHSVQIERPKAFVDHVQAFLRSC